MRKLLALLILVCASGGSARAQTGTIVLSATSTPAPIVVNQNSNYVVVQENSANPSNAFTITLPGQATGINYAAGTKFIFSAAPGGYTIGSVLGTISVSGGTVAFIGIESTQTPTVPAPSTTGGGGGTGCTISSAANKLIKGNTGGTGCTPSLVTEDTTSASEPNAQVAESLAIQGPRPYIDVTAPLYGADPTNTVDSTSAIQAAITAACAIPAGSGSGRPAVYFPPGYYRLTHSTSSAPIFTTCSNLYIFSNGAASTNGQFSQPPEGATLSVVCTGTDGTGPIFGFVNASGTTNTYDTVEGMVLNGCYEAASAQYTSNIVFRNDYFSALEQSGNTAPLVLSNDLWIWVEHSQFAAPAGSYTDPTIVMTGETSLHGESQQVGLAMFSDIISTGGGFRYIQNVADTLSSPGSMTFRNITQENVNTPLLAFTEASPGLLPGVQNLEFDSVQQSDSTNGGNALLTFNGTAGYLSGISFVNSLSENDVGIQMLNGSLRSYDVPAPLAVLDASYNPVGTGRILGSFGSYNVSSSPTYCVGYVDSACNVNGPFSRYFKAGNLLSPLGLDAAGGVMFGDGATHGYSSAIAQNALADTDLMTAKYLPPTGFAGVATTGGSLSAGTYYAILWASNASAVNNCATAGLNSTFVYGAGVGVSGANNAVNFTWTLPQTTPGTLNGFCMQITTSAPSFDAAITEALFISGGATTSFLYTGQSQTTLGTVYPQTPMIAAHRFGYNFLAVNQTSCASWNLCVNGNNWFNGYSDVAEEAAPSNPASGFERWFANSSTHQLSCLTSSGGSCAPSGGGGPGTGTQYEPAYWSTTSALGSAAFATTPNGVPQILEMVPSGSALTAPTGALPGVVTRAVTGTTSTDTIASTDCNPGRVSYTTSVAVAVTLPTATTLAVPNCVFRIANNTSGSATAVTVTPTTWTVRGSSSIVIAQGQIATFYVDPAGSNWEVDVNDEPIVAGSNITITRGQYGPTVAASGGSSTLALLASGNPTSGAWTPACTANFVEALAPHSTYTLPTSVTTCANNNYTIFCSDKSTIIERGSGASGILFTGNESGIKGCTMDEGGFTASQIFIQLAGADDFVTDYIVQDPGTTSGSPVIDLELGSTRPLVQRGVFLGAQVDPGITINNAGSTSATTVGAIIRDNHNENFGPSSNQYWILVNQAGSGAVINDWYVTDNECKGTTTHAGCIGVTAQAAANNLNIARCHIDRNNITASAVLNHAIHAFGLSWCEVNNNVVSDGGSGVEEAAIDFGDIYNTSVTGNDVDARGGLEYGIELVDGANNTVSSNSITGIGNGDAGIFLATAAGVMEYNTVVSNSVSLSASGACYLLIASYASGPVSFNQFGNNTCNGTNANAQLGVNLVDTSGGVSSNSFSNMTFVKLTGTGDVAYTVGSGSSANYLGTSLFSSVTTMISDSGTNTVKDTVHSGPVTYTLSGGTATVTLPVTFSSASTAVCAASDTTSLGTASNAALASTTTVTVKGTSTDGGIVRCDGY